MKAYVVTAILGGLSIAMTTPGIARQLDVSRLARESSVDYRLLHVAGELNGQPAKIFGATTNRLYIDDQFLGSSSDRTIVRIVESRSGRFHATLSCDQEPNSAGCSIDFFDSRRFIRSISIPYRHDDPYPVLAISEADGSIAFGQPATGGVSVLGKDGATVFERVSANAGFEIERSMVLQWNGNGDRLLVVRELDAPGARARPENISLAILGPQGREVLSQTVPGRALSATVLSESGRTAVISGHDIWSGTKGTTILHLKSRTQSHVAFMAERIQIDRAEQSIVLSNKHDLLVTGLDGSIHYAMKSLDHPRVILDAGLSPDGKTVSIIDSRADYREGKFIFSNAELRLIDLQSAVSNEAPEAVSRAVSHAVSIPGTNRHLVLIPGDREATAISDTEIIKARIAGDG